MFLPYNFILISALLVTFAIAAQDEQVEEDVDSKKSCSKYGYQHLLHGCYKYYTEHKTWRQANSTCTADGGYLAVINDKQEMQTLKEIYKINKNYYGMHVGLNYDVASKKWISVQGDPIDSLYNVWIGGSPPDDEILTCGVLMATMKYLDWPCDGEYGIYQPFLCEKSLS